MRISINGPQRFTDSQIEQILDKYKNDDKRLISL